jgi:hypothetical protein
MKNNHLITTVINYCTNDYRFIKKCVTEAEKFSHQIIIPVSDHFFNGKKENRKLLNLSYLENPSCEFIEYEFTHDKSYSKYKWFAPSSIESRHIWHSASRYISHFFIKKESDYILFLDADEIPDGEGFLRWLDLQEYKKYFALRLACYFYFNSPILRSSIFQNSALLIKQEGLDPFLLLELRERFATFSFAPGKKIKMVLSPEKKPLIHHYSWVRPKKEKIIKSQTWGHFSDKNWEELIANDSEDPNIKNDPYYNLPLEKAPSCFFDPLSISPDLNQKIPKKFSNVKKVSYLDIFQKELEIQHGI